MLSNQVEYTGGGILEGIYLVKDPCDGTLRVWAVLVYLNGAVHPWCVALWEEGCDERGPGRYTDDRRQAVGWFVDKMATTSFTVVTPVRGMTPTAKLVSPAEYERCSSDRCPHCGIMFFILDSGWSVSCATECPHCKEQVIAQVIRRARKEKS